MRLILVLQELASNLMFCRMYSMLRSLIRGAAGSPDSLPLLLLPLEDGDELPSLSLLLWCLSLCRRFFLVANTVSDKDVLERRLICTIMYVVDSPVHTLLLRGVIYRCAIKRINPLNHVYILLGSLAIFLTNKNSGWILPVAVSCAKDASAWRKSSSSSPTPSSQEYQLDPQREKAIMAGDPSPYLVTEPQCVSTQQYDHSTDVSFTQWLTLPLRRQRSS